MIPVYKLQRLPPGQRRRKLVMMLSEIERSLVAGSHATKPITEESVYQVVEMVLQDPALEEKSRNELIRLLANHAWASDAGRLVNTARHALLAVTGSLPAEWDLIMPGSDSSSSEQRFFFPGVHVYAEDIRSPFNLGSIFRTAEAFGAEAVFISPLCVSPEHQRAQRSAMGCTDFIPWKISELSDLPVDLPVFALETGGTAIDEFVFPEKGIVIVGSEELGISPEGLKKAEYGRVSIPMRGIKASINVGVAFGILMQYWSSYLADS